MQAGDRFRGGSEGGIAGCRVPAPASLDELDLVRVQAAHGSYGELAAGRAGRVRVGYRFGGRVQRGVLGEHLGQRGGAVGGRDVGGEDLDGHRAGDPVQMENVGPGQVAAGAVGRGPHDRHPEVTGGRHWTGRLPGAVAGRPVTERPGQLAAPRRCVGRVHGPHGMGGPDGAVEQRGAQRGHQPRHPRRDHSRPAIAIDGLREVADPLRETVVVAERLPPLEPGRYHRVHRCPACPGEPARPAVDVVSAIENGQRLAGHGSAVDEPVRQLEAGRRHPLERLIQGRRRVTHVVLLRAREPLPQRFPRRSAATCCSTASAACAPGYGAVYSADGCVTPTESHSWPRAAALWPLLMRLARSQPELPGKRLFPAAVVWAPRTSLEPALPAILIHKDESAGGSVTGPARWQPGRAAHNRRVEGLAAARSCGYYRGFATSMPATRTSSEQAWAWLPVRSGPLDTRVIGVLAA